MHTKLKVIVRLIKPSQNKKGEKNSRCTVFGVFFYSWPLRKRHRKRCTWNFFWSFLFLNGFRNFLMQIHKIFGPIVLSHKSSSEMSASGYVTLLIRSVESSPSLIASYHLAFKRVLKNNNFFKNHFLISNLTVGCGIISPDCTELCEF